MINKMIKVLNVLLTKVQDHEQDSENEVLDLIE